MAYIKKEEETEQGGINQTLGQDSETPQLSTGLGSGGSSTPSAASTASQDNKAPSSGTFTNLQNYVDQNKPAAQGIAEAATSKMGEGADEVQSQVESQQSNFMEQVAKQRADLQSAQAKVSSQVESAGQQEFQPQDIQTTQQLATGQYNPQAPTLNLGEQSYQTDRLMAPAEAAQTQQGRLDLLSDTFRNQGTGYSRGQRSLDELVLAGDEGARQHIAEQPKARVQALKDIMEQAQIGATSTLSDLGTERQLAMQGAASEIEAARETLRDQITNRYTGFKSGIEGGNLTAGQLAELGVTEGQRTYGADLMSALEKTKGISTADSARLDALAKLGNTNRQLYSEFQGGDVQADIQALLSEQERAFNEAEIAEKKAMFAWQRENNDAVKYDPYGAYLGEVFEDSKNAIPLYELLSQIKSDSAASGLNPFDDERFTTADTREKWIRGNRAGGSANFDLDRLRETAPEVITGPNMTYDEMLENEISRQMAYGDESGTYANEIKRQARQSGFFDRGKEDYINDRGHTNPLFNATQLAAIRLNDKYGGTFDDGGVKDSPKIEILKKLLK